MARRRTEAAEAAVSTNEEVKTTVEVLESSDKDKFNPEVVADRVVERLRKTHSTDPGMEKWIRDVQSQYEDHRDNFGIENSSDPRSKATFERLKGEDAELAEALANFYSTSVLDSCLVLDKLLEECGNDPVKIYIAVKTAQAQATNLSNLNSTQEAIEAETSYLRMETKNPGVVSALTKNTRDVSRYAPLTFNDFVEGATRGTAGGGSAESNKAHMLWWADRSAEKARDAMGNLVALSESYTDPNTFTDKEVYPTTETITTKVKRTETRIVKHDTAALEALTEEELRKKHQDHWAAEVGNDENKKINATIGKDIRIETFMGEKAHTPRQSVMLLHQRSPVKNGMHETVHVDIETPSITLYADQLYSDLTGAPYKRGKNPIVHACIYNEELDSIDKVGMMNEMLKMATTNPDGSRNIFIVHKGKPRMLVVDDQTFNQINFSVQRSLRSWGTFGVKYNPKDVLIKQLTALDGKPQTTETVETLVSQGLKSEGMDPDDWIKHRQAMAQMEAMKTVAISKLNLTPDEINLVDGAFRTVENIYADASFGISQSERLILMAEYRLNAKHGVKKGQPNYDEGMDFELGQVAFEYSQLSVTLKSTYATLMQKMAMIGGLEGLSEGDKQKLRSDILVYLSKLDKLILEQNQAYARAMGGVTPISGTKPAVTLRPVETTTPAVPSAAPTEARTARERTEDEERLVKLRMKRVAPTPAVVEAPVGVETTVAAESTVSVETTPPTPKPRPLTPASRLSRNSSTGDIEGDIANPSVLQQIIDAARNPNIPEPEPEQPEPSSIEQPETAVVPPIEAPILPVETESPAVVTEEPQQPAPEQAPEVVIPTEQSNTTEEQVSSIAAEPVTPEVTTNEAPKSPAQTKRPKSRRPELDSDLNSLPLTRSQMAALSRQEKQEISTKRSKSGSQDGGRRR